VLTLTAASIWTFITVFSAVAASTSQTIVSCFFSNSASQPDHQLRYEQCQDFYLVIGMITQMAPALCPNFNPSLHEPVRSRVAFGSP
jgi:hypothetical protein